MFEERDDTILARWLDGRLTPEERADFEKSPEFEEYQAMVKGMARFKKPDFDGESLLQQLHDKIQQPQKRKVIALRPLLYVAAVAASIVLIAGLFFNEVTYTTGVGEQLAVVLPDGSEVQLNAQSSLTRKRFFWNNDKVVTLSGEGLFDVEKGDGFSVETNAGVVSVLGTSFNVRTRKDRFSLACYEGKVQFETTSQKEILVQGEGLKLVQGQVERTSILGSVPDWTQGRSDFENAPLQQVLEELSLQYGIEFSTNDIDLSRHFTGSFVHNDLTIALQTVLTPMSINYEILDNQKTVVLRSP